MSENFTRFIRVFDGEDEEIVSIDADTNEIILNDDQGSRTMHINAKDGDLFVGGFQNPGRVLVQNSEESVTADLRASLPAEGGGGRISLLRGSQGGFAPKETVALNADGGSAVIGGANTPGALIVLSDRDVVQEKDKVAVRITGDGNLIGIQNDNETETIRLRGSDSTIALKDTDGKDTISMDGGVGKIQLQSLELKSPRTGERSIQINGRSGNIILGGTGNDGELRLTDSAGETVISLDGGLGQAQFGGFGKNGKISLENDQGSQTITLDSRDGSINLNVARFGGFQAAGKVTMEDKNGNANIILDGENGNAEMKGNLALDTILLQGKTGTAVLGGKGQDGELFLKNSTDRITVSMDGNAGSVVIGGGGRGGNLRLNDGTGRPSITMNGDQGEVSFAGVTNGAMDFDVVNETEASPGTVMVQNEDGRLSQSTRPFDRRVVGVVSGLKETRPGLVLDRERGTLGRRPIALTGKVLCKVDATRAPIDIGDLLTTSPTAGHAMKADSPEKAFGAVIGKALGALRTGKGLLPILIALQ